MAARPLAHTVALAVIDDMPLFELGIACEVFGPPRPDLADPWYDLRICAATPARSEFGFQVRTVAGLDAVAEAATVIVPALPYACVMDGRPVPAELVEALSAAARAGARMVSLCTGAFALAAAGLLDGRRAATHWMYADLLRRRHPRVQVDDSVLYVDEGDVLTSAGRTAGLDLCLHVVRTDLGAHVANQLARRMVAPAHRPGGQAQYVEVAVPKTDGDALGPLLDWITERLDRPLTVAALARRAGMSPRTFARRFLAATGTTPLRWLLARRVIRARDLLEATDLPIDQVAERSGLGSPANLRRHFAERLGVAPGDYRRAFRARTRAASADRIGDPLRGISGHLDESR
ncbi:helix-turn-helix domain-containing protein [Spongiactinospora sp. TRM90649]|uniref:helix-turn-helix domain-containing protein n=1 Tax=Spongiactinospora sp. TRM90649 TaxID=3031114 RepID=UPI0023F66834|nr:helix-turn-helix domain-containing protein [Spongiactinospora sp. TRM90649]MDF5755776.1 helix-turn-helix domain-containing protein [Spongiactinospora sp. TRM90649]